MKIIVSLFAVITCAATNNPAAELKKPAPSASDALFDPTRVIQIEIRMAPKDWHALRISHPDLDEDLVPIRMNYEYYRADVLIDGQLVKSAGVRKKGTWGSTTRPSLKIKFDKYVKRQEFRELKMVTLNNFQYSPTKAHQSLVYSLMRKAGAIAPRSNLVRVVVNGEELGVYGHVESIDKNFIKRHFGDARGDLYEGWYGADFTTNGYKKIEHKWGNDADLAHVRRLTDVLEKPQPVLLEEIEAQVDLNAFLAFWAAEVLVGQTDAYPYNANNYYLYRDADSRKLFFIPWGADIAFAYWAAGERVPSSVWAGGQLCRRLWESPEIRERYRAEMRRLLTDVWDEKTMIAELNQIRRLCQVDRPQGVTRGDKAAASLMEKIKSRREQVQAELNAPARDWPLPRLEPKPLALPVDTNNPPMLLEGSFSAVIAEVFPTNAEDYFGRGTAVIDLSVRDETRKPFTRLGAMAVMRTDFGLGEENRVQIVAMDEAGDLRWDLWFRLDPYRVPLTPGKLEFGHWTVRAPVFQIAPKRQARYAQQTQGTLELTQVSTNLGGTIAGNFRITTTAFEEEKTR